MKKMKITTYKKLPSYMKKVFDGEKRHRLYITLEFEDYECAMVMTLGNFISAIKRIRR